ncbi:MAG: ferrous iron transport protein B [Deltaproteobacteria bacterium]|nr:ferrous iron transport protein B [Deltaproteobacteria bacterium]
MSVVALAGNPNCGKTTLFNKLTGLNQKVGNYPGVTVERRSGSANFAGRAVTVVDLPGTYSLISRSRDEAIAFEVLTGHGEEAKPAVTVIVVDASNLDRNLYLALSILELGHPAVVALNMMDVAEKAGVHPDPEALSAALGVPVVPVVAKSGLGVDKLQAAVVEMLNRPVAPPARGWHLDEAVERAVAELKASLHAPERPENAAEGEAVWLLSSLATAERAGTLGTEDDPFVSFRDLGPVMDVARQQLRLLQDDLPAQVIQARYAQANQISAQAVRRGEAPAVTTTDRIDHILLHPILGAVIFLGVMALLFQSIFAWADPLMGGIEDTVGFLQAAATSALPEGALRDLFVDGVIGGVGNVVVFVPQIAILFLFIAVLEDSGYLSRAAFISDRFMARVGLHGRAFVPLLSGFACAIPAVMATRSIENRRDRLVTILVLPLVTCSARLPVYTLIIASLFAAEKPVLGVFTVGGLLMLMMYVLSVTITVAVAFLLKRTLLKSPTPPLVLELPPYRWPEPMSVARRVYERCKVFVRDAGTVILALSIILWAMLYFPRQVEPSFDVQREKMLIEHAYQASIARERNESKIAERQASRDEAWAFIDRRVEAERVKNSVAGRIGHGLEPIIEPLGYDWRIGVGLLASFAAREVFVSTLGLVYGVGEEVDEESVPLRQRLRSEVDPKTGDRIYTPLVGLSLMIFFLLAAQCMSTVAVVRRETNSWRWPAFMVAYMTVLAWSGAFLVYQGGRLLGFQ